MKTTIVVTLLAVGMLLRPQPAFNVHDAMIPTASVTAVSTHATATHPLSAADMSNAIGNGLSGCTESKAANGDTYVTCCLDLWIFAICVAVNWSALERIIPFA
ncbi:MAG TPA: hypothetical protein VMH23_19200 [Bacteroidota bacterium]|nr:hypothetical protein [Bacteroidota bacterium]